jgi:hypothetical protein
MAVVIRGGAESGKVEQTVNSGDIPVSVFHGGYSNPPVAVEKGLDEPATPHAPGRHRWN